MRPISLATALLTIAVLVSPTHADLIVTSVTREASVFGTIDIPGVFNLTQSASKSSTLPGTFDFERELELTQPHLGQSYRVQADATQTSTVQDNHISGRLYTRTAAFTPQLEDIIYTATALTTNSLAVSFDITEPGNYRLAGELSDDGQGGNPIEILLDLRNQAETFVYTFPDRDATAGLPFDQIFHLDTGSYNLLALVGARVQFRPGFDPGFGGSLLAINFAITAVPEPSSIGLAVVGGAGIFLLLLRRKVSS